MSIIVFGEGDVCSIITLEKVVEGETPDDPQFNPYCHQFTPHTPFHHIPPNIFFMFLSDPGKPGVRSVGPDVGHSLRDV